jgi:hypothetical protein
MLDEVLVHVFIFCHSPLREHNLGQTTMKYAFCPIHDFYRLAKKPNRDTDQLHSLYVRAYLSCNQKGRKLGRAKIAWRKCKITLQSALWPLACIASALRYTMRYGALALKISGKSVPRQFLEQLHLGLSEGVPPRSYYLFSLFEESRKDLAPAFVHYHENNYLAAMFVTHADRETLNGKLRFYEFCHKSEIPSPPVLAVFRNGEQVRGGGLPASDMIVKPLAGYSGHNVERWVCDKNGEYFNGGQRPLSRRSLQAHLKQKSEKGGLLVQPRLLNHGDLAGCSSGGLCTARLVTVRSPGKEPELVAAMLRMPTGNSVVDNFSAGGIACPIDAITGVVSGPARSWAPLSTTYDLHPDTAQKIEGVQLPDWSHAVHICKEAHSAFKSCPAIGWDVAFTSDGPTLVEGNLPFGIELAQIISGTPLLTTPFLEAHLRLTNRTDEQTDYS